MRQIYEKKIQHGNTAGEVADELTNIYEINEMIDKLISNATFYKIDESKLPLEDAIIDIKNTLTRYLEVEEYMSETLTDYLTDTDVKQPSNQRRVDYLPGQRS